MDYNLIEGFGVKKKINDMTVTGNYQNIEITPTENGVIFETREETVYVFLDNNGINSIEYNTNECLHTILGIVKKSPTIQEILEEFGISPDELTYWFEN